MQAFAQTNLKNELLRALSPDDFSVLATLLRPAEFHVGDVLMQADQPIADVLFPESGVISVVKTPMGVESAVVGWDGLIGLSVVLETERCPLSAHVQLAGHAFQMPAPALREACAASRSMRRVLLRYAHTFLVQVAETACANARNTVEQRLARSLLMCHDRVGGDELVLTHEFLATMLGVRRPGVTVATHVLEGEGMIRARRGRITVLDRERLIEVAGSAYLTTNAERSRAVARREPTLPRPGGHEGARVAA